MFTFPILLRSRLCEESHFRIAKATIDARVGKLEADHRNRGEGRTVETKAAGDELTSFLTTKKAIDGVFAQLSAEILELAEGHVLETSESYARSATAFHNIGEWTDGIDVLETRLAAFLKELGKARPLAGAGCDHAGKRVSAGAQAAVNRAIDAAIPLQQQVRRLNEFADALEDRVRGTPAARAVIPRIPVGDYIQWTRNLIDIPVLEMPAEFARIIGQCEAFLEFGIPQLRAAGDEVPAAGREHNKAYLQAYIGILRDLSCRNLYEYRNSECRLAEVARRHYGRLKSAASPPQEAPAPGMVPSAA